MIDQVLLSAGITNIDECISLANERGLGIEVMAFAYPHILEGDWEALIAEYKHKLAGVSGPITLHGPFMDMVSGSPDPRINQVCFERYMQAIEIAAKLNARTMVLHANFIGSLHNLPYRESWHKRNVEFWNRFCEQAQGFNVTVAIENMWEFDPTIIADLVSEVNHPILRACVDVGHAHLFSDPQYTLHDWLKAVEPWLVHMHMNNNNGKVDVHHAFNYDEGVLNYHEILKLVRAINQQPLIVLEMDTVQDMRESLSYLSLQNNIENVSLD